MEKLIRFSIVFAILYFLLYPALISAQVDNPPTLDRRIQSAVYLITTETVGTLTKEISGESEVTIGGAPYTIETRYAYTNSNRKAREYIKEKLSSYGLETRYDNFNNTGANVIGKKTGAVYPNQYYIICCHFDDMPPVTTSAIAPGADDNGSGVVGILEAGRIMSAYTFDYSVMFIAFDEEEIDILGSGAYATDAYNRGDSIIGVVNLDMIAYDKNNDGKFEVLTNAVTETFADDYIAAVRLYTTDLIPVKDKTETGSSDHVSFNKKGYKAFHVFEDSQEENPNMHSKEDNYANGNMTYLRNIVRSVTAFVMGKAGMQ
ncbi:MAG: M28 family peptidase [Bacteroidetes bacterium]|nr:M28 family peptidase [Bacteroidota bacterium]